MPVGCRVRGDSLSGWVQDLGISGIMISITVSLGSSDRIGIDFR